MPDSVYQTSDAAPPLSEAKASFNEKGTGASPRSPSVHSAVVTRGAVRRWYLATQMVCSLEAACSSMDACSASLAAQGTAWALLCAGVALCGWLQTCAGGEARTPATKSLPDRVLDL